MGLIFASFVIALYLPFELFLFAYAILGPAHYLTEISWLQKRRFFARAGYDGWVLWHPGSKYELFLPGLEKGELVSHKKAN